MAEKKTMEERYADDILTNNEILNHLMQCKDYSFRDKTTVNGEECGWKKCFCHVYGKKLLKIHHCLFLIFQLSLKINQGRYMKIQNYVSFTKKKRNDHF